MLIVCSTLFSGRRATRQMFFKVPFCTSGVTTRRQRHCNGTTRVSIKRGKTEEAQHYKRCRTASGTRSFQNSRAFSFIFFYHVPCCCPVVEAQRPVRIGSVFSSCWTNWLSHRWNYTIGFVQFWLKREARAEKKKPGGCRHLQF